MEFTIHLQILAIVFVTAIIMGAVANKTNFCTMGAVSDWVNMGDTGRLRAWLLAMALALTGVLVLEGSGTVSLDSEVFPPYRTANFVEQHLLRPGGVVTTPNHSGQQWDAPNGWAPLQWIAIAGLRNYGFDLPAEMIRSRWIDLNQKVYRNTGKMMEKYNVEDLSLSAGGGEYPVQDGFGWSNGVLLRLLSEGWSYPTNVQFQ